MFTLAGSSVLASSFNWTSFGKKTAKPSEASGLMAHPLPAVPASLLWHTEDITSTTTTIYCLYLSEL